VSSIHYFGDILKSILWQVFVCVFLTKFLCIFRTICEMSMIVVFDDSGIISMFGCVLRVHFREVLFVRFFQNMLIELCCFGILVFQSLCVLLSV